MLEVPMGYARPVSIAWGEVSMTAGKLLGYILVLCAGILSILTWYTFQNLGGLMLMKVYISPLVFLVLLLACVLLTLYLFDDIIALAVLALIPLSYVVFFGMGWPYITAAILSLVLFLIGMRRSKINKAELLHLKFPHVATLNGWYVGLGFMALLLGLVYGGLTTLDRIAVPQQFFDYGIRYARPIVNWALPGISTESTIDDFLALQMLRQGTVRISVSDIPQELREEVLRKAGTESGEINLVTLQHDRELSRRLSETLINVIKQEEERSLRVQRQSLSDQFRIGALHGDETIGKFAYLVVNRYALDYASGDQKTYVLVGLVVVGFLILRSIFWIFSMLAIGIGGFILYWLKSSGVVHLERITVEKEVLIV